MSTGALSCPEIGAHKLGIAWIPQTTGVSAESAAAWLPGVRVLALKPRPRSTSSGAPTKTPPQACFPSPASAADPRNRKARSTAARGASETSLFSLLILFLFSFYRFSVCFRRVPRSIDSTLAFQELPQDEPSSSTVQPNSPWRPVASAGAVSWAGISTLPIVAMTSGGASHADVVSSAPGPPFRFRVRV